MVVARETPRFLLKGHAGLISRAQKHHVSRLGPPHAESCSSSRLLSKSPDGELFETWQGARWSKSTRREWQERDFGKGKLGLLSRVASRAGRGADDEAYARGTLHKSLRSLADSLLLMSCSIMILDLLAPIRRRRDARQHVMISAKSRTESFLPVDPYGAFIH